MLEVLEPGRVRCVPLCRLEAVDSVLCLLKVPEVILYAIDCRARMLCAGAAGEHAMYAVGAGGCVLCASGAGTWRHGAVCSSACCKCLRFALYAGGRGSYALYGRSNGRCALYARGAEGVPFCTRCVGGCSAVYKPALAGFELACSLVAALYAGGDALCTTGAELSEAAEAAELRTYWDLPPPPVDSFDMYEIAKSSCHD